MGSQPQSVCLSPHDAFEWRVEPLEDMGGRGSKTKPNSPARATSRRAVSFRTDAVVGVDPLTECVDDLRLHDRASDDESLGHVSAAKVSKVQEILEGKVELKKNQQMLEHLPPSATTVATLELQFSSSEDSDETARSAKRKGSKKKVRKRRSVSERAAPSPSPSPVKLKLNELKVPKRPLAQQQQSQLASFVQDHFEQIKDAYALAEYSSKDTTDDSQTYRHQPHAPLQSQPSQPSSPQHRPRQEQQRSPSPRQYSPHKLKQQQQPGSSSPGKFFANPLDNWRISTNSSIQSIRSQIMEPRHPSRRSPPKSANHSTHSTKSHSSREADHAPGSRPLHSRRSTNAIDLDVLDLDDMDAEDSFSIPAVRNRAIERKIAEARQPVGAELHSKRYRSSGRRKLRIDDLDESIMDDILAEVVT